MKFQTPYNRTQFFNDRYYDNTAEVNLQPSLTIPDETLSIREILLRHSRGLPLTDINRIPVYDEENDLPDMRTLDISERHALIQEYRDRVMDLRKKHAKELDDKRRQIILEEENRKKQQQQQQQNPIAKPDNPEA